MPANELPKQKVGQGNKENESERYECRDCCSEQIHEKSSYRRPTVREFGASDNAATIRFQFAGRCVAAQSKQQRSEERKHYGES